MKKIIYSILVMSMLAYTSCSEDDLEPTLAQDKDVNLSVNTSEDLAGILNGAYNRISATAYYGRDYIIFGEVRSDNTYANGNSNRFVTVAEMDMIESDGYANDTWAQIYRVIANANIIINKSVDEMQLDAADEAADIVYINHLKGQAYAMRAMAHFDLLRLYGQQYLGNNTLGVPYVTTFRDSDNLYPSRNSVEEVRDMAYDDLDMAISLMTPSLDDASAQTLTTFGAYAIKARIANFFGDDSVAIDAAGYIINNGGYSIASASEFAATFSVDSAPNSIYEIAASSTDNNGINGLANIYRGSSYGDISVLQDLIDIYDASDVRAASNMIDAANMRNVGKYPTMGTFEDNISVIRYEEIILIYAEALLSSNPGSALTYLNMIPQNRSASTYGVATLDNILLERRKELAFEGFRFYDLARTGNDIPLVDAVNQTHGGVTYGSYNYAFPIPVAETGSNGNVSQNEGY